VQDVCAVCAHRVQSTSIHSGGAVIVDADGRSTFPVVHLNVVLHGNAAAYPLAVACSPDCVHYPRESLTTLMLSRRTVESPNMTPIRIQKVSAKHQPSSPPMLTSRLSRTPVQSCQTSCETDVEGWTTLRRGSLACRLTFNLRLRSTRWLAGGRTGSGVPSCPPVGTVAINICPILLPSSSDEPPLWPAHSVGVTECTQRLDSLV